MSQSLDGPYIQLGKSMDQLGIRHLVHWRAQNGSLFPARINIIHYQYTITC